MEIPKQEQQMTECGSTNIGLDLAGLEYSSGVLCCYTKVAPAKALQSVLLFEISNSWTICCCDRVHRRLRCTSDAIDGSPIIQDNVLWLSKLMQTKASDHDFLVFVAKSSASHRIPHSHFVNTNDGFWWR